jgi:signal transduction histidine kinase
VPYSRVNDPEKLQRLVAAVLMIAGDIALPDLLDHLVQEACSLVDARYGALGVLDSERTRLEQFLTVGLSETDEEAIGARPTGRGVLGLVITEPVPLRIADLSVEPKRLGFPQHHPPMKSFLGVPIRVRDEVYGNLYLTDKIGAEEFSDEDEALAEALALAAGVAIENTRLQGQVSVLSVLDERDRIARDLHDKVIQRIFAVGMNLQGAVRVPDATLVAAKVERAIEDLDATISEIRTAIFELGDGAPSTGLRQGVLAVVDEMTPTLRDRPSVIFEGPIDTLVSQPVADQLLAALREGLANASRHARATAYTVSVLVGESVVLEILDNGIGFDPAVVLKGRGLTNLQNRAESLGGKFELAPASAGGTCLIWSVPIEY